MGRISRVLRGRDLCVETMLGVSFLASEYVVGCDGDGGRIDSLGIDENGSPVVVEHKRGTDSGVINQGLSYMSWLVAHRDAFRTLVRERLGAMVACQIPWSAAGQRGVRQQGGALAELAEAVQAVDEALLGVGDGVTRVQRQQYVAYQRLCDSACAIPPRQTKLLVYLKANPKTVDLIPGYTRNVTGLGHHGTGNPEVQLRTERDLVRARDLFRLSYAAV
ncbi:transporter [Streptomyces noursei]|uniref:transporter n=1 Tax=Streptomyces noursei TaxID=1971 RepID=UPI001F0419BD|nr:transporter [Streptomyces noursei]